MLLTTNEWRTVVSADIADADGLVDELLNSRGIVTPEEKENFVSSESAVWHDPFLFMDMQKAVDLIVDTVDKKQKILVYGDYDCDGVTATSILVRFFRSHGADVDYIVPHRAEHGYGLTENIMDKVIEANPYLVITVDCGITNLETVAELKNRGIHVIVSDHHNVKEELPAADAVICAKREDNTYPFKDLCGAGVALKIVQAMGQDGRLKVSRNIWRQSLELAGLATIADLVSVTDENRTLIKKAFKSMEDPANPGVRVMNEMLLEKTKTLDETFISFNVVPRINAAGRLYDSSDSLKLFLEDDERLVKQAANDLTKQNDERKAIEAMVFSEAVKQVENPNRPEQWQLTNTCGPIVIYGNNWHQGVLGIVAGKVSQYFRRTAIVFTSDPLNPNTIKGSGRAFADFDLYSALTDVSEYISNFGGHKKAAGVVVEKSMIGKFMQALEENCKKKSYEQGDGDGEDVLTIDAEVPFNIVSYDTYAKINVLRPFGIGNKMPLFCTKNLIISDIQPMSNGAHMRMDLINADDPEDGRTLSAVGFGMGQYLNILRVGDKVDLAYSMNEYCYRGETTLSLHITDISISMQNSFLWSKFDIAEKLYNSNMPIDQIVKISGAKEGMKIELKDFIPTAEHYSAVYRVLHKECSGVTSTADCNLLAKLVKMESDVDINPFQLKRCLDVFSEVGLLKLGNISAVRVCFTLLATENKVSLTESETYRRMISYEQ